MIRLAGLFVLGLILVAGSACSKGPAPTAEPAAQASAEPAHVEPPPPGMPDKADSPDKTVVAFLKAAQTGNKPLLTALLSTTARAETAKNNINFELDSYQNSKFTVGKYEFVTPEKDGAHVACLWIDRDNDGTEYKHDVIWVLRKEEGGWRLVGMITRPFPDKGAVIFNYEDIPSLERAKNFIETESQRRMQEEQRQAAAKQSPGDKVSTPATPANAADQSKSGVQREAMKSPPASTPTTK
jgi:hypothetical protein